MRIAVIGHDQISPRQYLLWEKTRQLDLAEVEVLAPEKWHGETADPTKITPVKTQFEGDIFNYMMNVEPHIRRFKPDWIVSMTELWRQQSLINLSVAKKINCRIAFFRWENLPLDDQLPNLYQHIEKQVLKHADLIICGNEDAKEITEKRTSVPIIKLLETGIDTAMFKPTGEPEKKSVLYLGRNAPEKRVEWIKNIVMGTPYAFTNANAGLYPYSELPKLISSHSVGAIASIDLPTWREQCCYVVGEMLACGTPVVSTDAGSIPEIWGSCQNVFISPQHDLNKFWHNIIDVVENPPDRDVAVNFIRENYSNEVLARRYMDALNG